MHFSKHIALLCLLLSAKCFYTHPVSELDPTEEEVAIVGHTEEPELTAGINEEYLPENSTSIEDPEWKANETDVQTTTTENIEVTSTEESVEPDEIGTQNPEQTTESEVSMHKKEAAQIVILLDRIMKKLNFPSSNWNQYAYVTALKSSDGSIYVPENHQKSTRKHLATLLGFAEEIIATKNALAEPDVTELPSDDDQKDTSTEAPITTETVDTTGFEASSGKGEGITEEALDQLQTDPVETSHETSVTDELTGVTEDNGGNFDAETTTFGIQTELTTTEDYEDNLNTETGNTEENSTEERSDNDYLTETPLTEQTTDHDDSDEKDVGSIIETTEISTEETSDEQHTTEPSLVEETTENDDSQEEYEDSTPEILPEKPLDKKHSTEKALAEESTDDDKKDDDEKKETDVDSDSETTEIVMEKSQDEEHSTETVPSEELTNGDEKNDDDEEKEEKTGGDLESETEESLMKEPHDEEDSSDKEEKVTDDDDGDDDGEDDLDLENDEAANPELTVKEDDEKDEQQQIDDFRSVGLPPYAKFGTR